MAIILHKAWFGQGSNFTTHQTSRDTGQRVRLTLFAHTHTRQRWVRSCFSLQRRRSDSSRIPTRVSGGFL